MYHVLFEASFGMEEEEIGMYAVHLFIEDDMGGDGNDDDEDEAFIKMTQVTNRQYPVCFIPHFFC